ncbi:hypothetical protein D3C76_753070 [compost metagenome]
MTPSGEGLAVFEPGLAIADLFAHHFHVHMPIILLVRKAPLGVSRQGLEFLKEMQGEGGEEDMVVLFLAASAFVATHSRCRWGAIVGAGGEGVIIGGH